MRNPIILFFAATQIMLSCSTTQQTNNLIGVNVTIDDDGKNSTDSLQTKANINTSRSNIKRGIQRPSDSLQQKANINTSRSNIKKGIKAPTDSLQQKANNNTVRSNNATIKEDGEVDSDNLQSVSGYDYTHRLTRGTNSVAKLDGGKEGLATCTMIYIGGGFTGLNNSTKENTHLANTKDLNIGVYLPIIKRSKIGYGLNIDVEYRFNNKDVTYLPKPIMVEGQSSSNVMLVNENDLTQSAYAISAGPQIQFVLGKKLLLSTMLHAAYMQMSQPAFEARQTINTGRENYTFNMLSQTGTEYNLFILKPAIRLAYLFKERFGLWAETNYQNSSAVKIQSLQFFPEGKADPDGFYTVSQIQNGTSKEVTTNTKFNAAGFKLGVAFRLNKGKDIRFKAGAELSDKVN